MKIFKLIVWVTTLFFSVTGTAQKISLDLKQGQKFTAVSTLKVNSIASVMGQDMESNVDNKNTSAYEVLRTGANEIEFREMLTNCVMNVQTMGQEMNYDSDKKDNSGPLAEELAKTIKKEIKKKIDANGNFLSMEPATSEETNSMISMFTGGGNANEIAVLNKTYINREIITGASWLDSTENKNGNMKSKIVLNYTVTGIADGMATISFTGVSSNAGTIEQMGQEMNMAGTAKIRGEAELNIKTGILSKIYSTSEGSSTIEAAGMSIPVTTKINTTTVITQ
jgi:hypothetical protein